MNWSIRILGILIFLGGLLACVKEPEWSTVPAITFKQIQKITKTSNDGFGGKAKIDSVIMSVNFQDGDGDLGITQAELKANPAKYKDFRNFEVNVLLKKMANSFP